MAAPMPDDFPESLHIAAGNGYSDDDRTSALEELASMSARLLAVPAWRLTPHTEALLSAERSLSAVESGVFADDAAVEAEEQALAVEHPAPVETDESTATWDADPFEVVADWTARTLPVVHLDEHMLMPATARRVAAVLLAAADRAEAGR